MVTKPARLLFLYVFVDLTVYNVEWRSYHYDLTDQQKRRINLFRHNLYKYGQTSYFYVKEDVSTTQRFSFSFS